MVSYTLAQRYSKGEIRIEPGGRYAVSMWRAMAWFPVGRTAVARGYAVTSSDGKVVRGYLTP